MSFRSAVWGKKNVKRIYVLREFIPYLEIIYMCLSTYICVYIYACGYVHTHTHKKKSIYAKVSIQVRSV